MQNASAQPASKFSKILAKLFPPLWCAGKLGNCPKSVERFRITCLRCRSRRRYLGKFSDPKYWIGYTYKAFTKTLLVDHIILNGMEYKRRDGQPFEIVDFMSVRIDPRGHFTALRYAAIVALDQIMKLFGVGKPLVEFCEFLADYPTW